LEVVTNAEIAAALEELGVLYELDGAVKYRVLAYSTAASAIRESPVSVAELAAQGRATEIPASARRWRKRSTRCWRPARSPPP
jgi:DNA polymerase/3'-5' exonuclease PolX